MLRDSPPEDHQQQPDEEQDENYEVGEEHLAEERVVCQNIIRVPVQVQLFDEGRTSIEFRSAQGLLKWS